MGLAYQSLDNHQSATKCFKNYLTAKPNDIKTHKLLANSFFILGDFDSAIKCYHRILEQDSNDAIVFFNLATAYESAAEFISANNSAEKSLTEEQSAKISKHLNNAILLYSKAISISPTFVEAYNNLGGVYLQLDNLSRARYFITEALKLNDSFPKAVFNMSLVHQRSKDEPNSIQLEIACLEKAKLLEPDNGQIYYNLARAYSMTDQQDKAKENLDKSQALLKEWLHQQRTLEQTKTRTPRTSLSLNRRKLSPSFSPYLSSCPTCMCVLQETTLYASDVALSAFF